MISILKVGLIDDIEREADEIIEVLDKVLNEINIEVNYSKFTKPNEFIKKYKKGDLEIIFIDIYMDEILGIDLAYKIREVDKDVLIIFSTNSEDFAVKSYDVGALYYMVKPIGYEKMKRVVNLAVEKIGNLEKSISVMSNRVKCNILLKDIIYIASSRNFVEFYTNIDTLKVYTTFDKVLDSLRLDNRFVNCMRGIMVNLDYVKEVTKNNCVLFNNNVVPIRQKDANNIKRLHAEYIVDKVRNIKSL